MGCGLHYTFKNRIVRSDIRKWMRRPDLEKTWPNFKHEFIEAHQELRNTYATMDELSFYIANTIVLHIFEQLRNKVPNEIPPDDENTRTPNLYAQPRIRISPTPISEKLSNAVQQGDPAMATAMTIMMANTEAMRLYIEGADNNRGYGGRYRGDRGRDLGRQARDHGREGRVEQHRGGKYCHTHGNCDHQIS